MKRTGITLMPMLVISILLYSIMPASAQTSKWKALALSNAAAYQARGISVSVYKETYAGLEGQQYTVKFTNTSTQKLKIKGSLIAQTYCGKSVSTAIDITIKPGQTMGGNDYLMDSQGLTGTVQSEDCKTEKIYLNPNDKNHYEYDRISGLALSAISVDPVADENNVADKTTPTTTGSSNSSPVNTTIAVPNNRSAAIVNGPPTNKQAAQYQQQANNYINAANASTDDIQKAMNLNLAKINAAANGNKAQVQQIQLAQNDQMATNITNGVTSLMGLFLSGSHHEKETVPAPDPNDKGLIFYYKGDYKEALKWYKKAANDGNADAMLNIGLMYENSKGRPQDYVMALEWYKKAAERGNVSAMFKTATIYSYGKGVTKDNSLAFQWYKRAAENGSVFAMFNMGYFLSNGIGIPQDYTQALFWYTEAAKRGDCEAMSNIGIMYNQGKGVAQDYNKAIEWFKKAVEDDDDSAAMYNLAAMYAQGHGTTVDNVAAFKWFKRSADLGNAGSLYTLGRWYQDGIYVTKDLPTAIAFYNKAAEKDNEAAKIALKKLGY